MTEIVTRRLPLGSQWPVRDPFLFCVHHDDAYPPVRGAIVAFLDATIGASPQAGVAAKISLSVRQAEAIVTTQKDAVRFPKIDRRDLPIYFMRVEIKILSGADDFQDCVRKICFR